MNECISTDLKLTTNEWLDCIILLVILQKNYSYLIFITVSETTDLHDLFLKEFIRNIILVSKNILYVNILDSIFLNESRNTDF